MKRAVGSLAVAITLPAASFSAAITNVSVFRTVTADAQAGGAGSQTVNSTAGELFDEIRTDEETFPNGSAKVIAAQRSLLTVTTDRLDFEGDGYTRQLFDGELVATTGGFRADIYFTIDSASSFTMAARTGLAGYGPIPSGFVFGLQLFRLTPSGESIVASGGSDGTPRTGTVAAGSYHLVMESTGGHSVPAFQPQSMDRTAYVTGATFSIPEPSPTFLLGSGCACILAFRRACKYSARAAQS
jgi:hypothetical protein